MAQPGEVVLFSPGTSSFDMFKSYADRGNQFRALVQALPRRPTPNSRLPQPLTPNQAMPAVPPTPRVKLRSTSRRVPRARRQRGGAVGKPNRSQHALSRAILVMLLLHVVAVGGILAFSLIKERNPAPAAGRRASSKRKIPSCPRRPAADDRTRAGRGRAAADVHVVRPGETLTRIANANGVSLEALVAANGADHRQQRLAYRARN